MKRFGIACSICNAIGVGSIFFLINLYNSQSVFAQDEPTTTFGKELDRFADIVGQFNTIVNILVIIGVAAAFLFFFWGLAIFLLDLGGEKGSDAIKSGKDKMIWGVIAIFVLTSLWGMVYFLERLFLGDNYGYAGIEIFRLPIGQDKTALPPSQTLVRPKPIVPVTARRDIAPEQCKGEDCDIEPVPCNPRTESSCPGDNTRSGDGDNTRSGDGDNTRSGDGDNTRSGDGDNTRSGDGDNTRSGDGDNTRSGDGDNTRSGDGDNTRSGDGDNTRGGGGTPTCDNRPDNPCSPTEKLQPYLLEQIKNNFPEITEDQLQLESVQEAISRAARRLSSARDAIEAGEINKAFLEETRTAIDNELLRQNYSGQVQSRYSWITEDQLQSESVQKAISKAVANDKSAADGSDMQLVSGELILEVGMAIFLGAIQETFPEITEDQLQSEVVQRTISRTAEKIARARTGAEAESIINEALLQEVDRVIRKDNDIREPTP